MLRRPWRDLGDLVARRVGWSSAGECESRVEGRPSGPPKRSMVSELMDMRRRHAVRGGFLALSLAALLALSACGQEEPKRSGDFKVNPGDFFCRGKAEVSPGDVLTIATPGGGGWGGRTWRGVGGGRG